MATVQGILRDFQVLGPSDQKKAWLAINALYDNSEKAKRSRDKEESHQPLFFEVLSDFLHCKTGDVMMPFARFRAVGYFKDFVAAFHHVEKFLNDHAPRGHVLTKNERRAFYNVYATVLYEYMHEKLNISADMRNLLVMHSKFAAALNDSFPGYIESGMIMATITGHLVSS